MKVNSRYITQLVFLDGYLNKCFEPVIAKKLPVTINNLRVQYSETSKTLKSNNQLLNDFETYMVKDVVNTVSSLQSLNTQVQVCAEKCQSYY